MSEWSKRNTAADSVLGAPGWRRLILSVIVGLFLVGAIDAAALSGNRPGRIPPGSAVTGGPDVWGYTYVDSDTASGVPGQPSFNWLDIRDDGTRVNGLSDDNSVGPFFDGLQLPVVLAELQFALRRVQWLSGL